VVNSTCPSSYISYEHSHPTRLFNNYYIVLFMPSMCKRRLQSGPRIKDLARADCQISIASL
jgi:hypothetical protein